MRRWVAIFVASFLILAVFKIALKSSIGFGLPWNYISSSCTFECSVDEDCKTEAQEKGCKVYWCKIPPECILVGKCKFSQCSGDGGGEEDPCKGVTCPDDGDLCTEEYCEDGTCKSRKICANEGESCNNLPCREGLECSEGCSGKWICCSSGRGAYCDDPPGGTPTSKCGESDCSSDGQDGGQEDEECDFCDQHPTDPGCENRDGPCAGCVDLNGDCYSEGSCVTSPICSSGWAKCHLEGGIYAWACAAEAECGGSGGGGGGGTGDVNEPTFDLLDVRVDILHDGINPEEPILKVECDEEDNESSGETAALLAVLGPVRTAGARGSFRGRIGFRRGPCTCPRPP